MIEPEGFGLVGLGLCGDLCSAWFGVGGGRLVGIGIGVCIRICVSTCGGIGCGRCGRGWRGLGHLGGIAKAEGLADTELASKVLDDGEPEHYAKQCPDGKRQEEQLGAGEKRMEH